MTKDEVYLLIELLVCISGCGVMIWIGYIADEDFFHTLKPLLWLLYYSVLIGVSILSSLFQ